MTKLTVGLLLIGAVIGAFWMFGPILGHRLHVENYSQIRVGMSQGEVEELLGGPPGDFGRNRHWGRCSMTLEGYWGPPGSVERAWYDDSTRLEIHFDGQGRVVDHHKREMYMQLRPSLAELWQMAQRKLRRLRRRFT